MSWYNPKSWRKPLHQEKKSLALGVTDALGRFLMFGEQNAGTPASALSLYDDSTAVSVPINKVADAFASIQPVLQFGDDKIETDHPVLELLKKPSPFYDGALFQEVVAKYYLVTNEISIIALGNINRPPLELQPISPSNATVPEGEGGLPTTVIVSGNTLAGIYKLELKKNTSRYFANSLRELKLIRGYATKNNSLLRGQSLLVSASKEARQHILGNQHNVSLLEKGGRVSLVFHFDEDMSPDDFAETKARVRAQYGGATNAGEIGVTAGGKLDIKEVGINNKDMDFANLQKMAQNSVALQYKVPLPLISNDAATFNNYSTALLALWDDAVLPLADKIYGGLSAFLLPRYGLDPTKVKITYNIDSITALASRRNEELKLRKELGIESDNELRAMIGREPYQGGDVILKPANLIPAGTDLLTTDDDPPIVLRDE